MRIVHEIGARAEVSVGCRAYTKSIKQKKSPGFSLDMLILVPKPKSKYSLVSEEEIYIEGDAKHILNMLKEAVEQIELAGQQYVDDGLISANWKKR